MNKEEAPGIGHNSAGGITAGRLKAFIERIERLEEEKKALGADITEVYGEAKAMGFDPKIMRKVIAKRKMDSNDLAEMEALIASYESALGDLKDTPLGTAAIDRARHGDV